MPIVRIESRQQRANEEAQALCDAVYNALCIGLNIPGHARHVIYVTHPSTSMLVPANVSMAYTIVTISLFSGRSAEAKSKLFDELALALAPFGIEQVDLFVSLVEQPKENWCIPPSR